MKHSLERTSPKGGPFIGTCVNCGTPNLRMGAAFEDCPNQRGVTEDEALIEAITREPISTQPMAWCDPTPEMLERPEFNAIWNCIKTWDINVPGAYSGYCGATGNHVRAILDALTAAGFSAGLRVAPKTTPQSQPPAGYSKLPAGVRCRCMHLWQLNSDFYCCNARVAR